MKKIGSTMAVFSMLISFPGAVFAAQDFDYYFGKLLVSNVNVVNSVPIQPVVAAQPQINQNQNANQIAAMQASLNQMKATLATLNSGLRNQPNLK